MTTKISDDLAEDVAAEERPAAWRRALPHLPFFVVLAAGVVLRWVTQGTYTPAIIYHDSEQYLANSVHLVPDRFPVGYSVLIKVALWAVHNLAVLPLLNHLLGLALGVLIYAALLRRGVAPWLAMLAAAPVLLDAYQLFNEQMVMSDVLFETFVVAGTVALLWNRRPGLLAAAVCGVSFAAAALTRDVGQPLVFAGVLYCLLVAGPRGRRLATAGILTVSFLLPVVAETAYAKTTSDGVGLSSERGARKLYARAASVADCAELRLPTYERPLCPPPRTVTPHWGSRIEAYKEAVSKRLRTPPGMTASDVYYDFIWRVVRHQPLDLARDIAGTFIRPFTEWGRTRRPGELPIARWLFSPTRGNWNASDAAAAARRWGGSAPATDLPKAQLLRDYQLTVGYTPGPVLLAGLVIGVAAAAGLGRAKRSGLRSACLLWVVVGAGLLLSADVYLFSWRYQLPALVTLPPAGALGLTAMFGGTDPRSLWRYWTSRQNGWPAGSAST